MDKKSIGLWAIGAYAAILMIVALFTTAGGSINLLPLAGAIGALFIYINRFNDSKTAKLASRLLTLATVVVTFISLIMAFTTDSIFVNLLFNLVSGVTVLAIIITSNKFTSFAKDCHLAVFIVSLAVCVNVVPFVLAFFRGVLGFVLSLLFIAGVVLFVLPANHAPVAKPEKISEDFIKIVEPEKEDEE